ALGQQTIAPWGAPPSASAAPPPPPASAAPPPPPVPGQYHLVIQGQQQGPYDLAGVRQWIASGQVTGQTLAWKPGMAQWVALQQFPEWATMAPGGPPPLPTP
ncbi:MAG: DUF4339 domain-containing protein, partial [Magnetococcales bacterium]|nr:DUF4339 domain-containing protein [Magnetococcales bacterium]